jgi:hypothetical protein
MSAGITQLFKLSLSFFREEERENYIGSFTFGNLYQSWDLLRVDARSSG